VALGSLLDKPSLGLHWRQEYIKNIGKWNDDVFIVPDMSRVFSQ
jgi:hypothetical protein